LLSNYNIKYACTIYTLLDTCFMSISGCSLRDKVTLRLLKLLFLWSRCGRVVYGSGHKAKRLVLQCTNGVSSNPVERRTKFDSSKYLMLTHLGLIFRRIYNIYYLPSIKSNFDIQWDIYSVRLSPA
jgi:hypothetical protein